MLICRGGNGMAGHKEIAFEGYSCCPMCKDREAMAGKVADLIEKIAELEMIIAKLEVDR